MGYKKIENMYRNVDVLLFKEVYAMEKLHGTSAHVTCTVLRVDDKPPEYKLTFFSGGGKHEPFVALFNQEQLLEAFKALGHDHVTVYGESYAGSCQGMSRTYGATPKFAAFEVQVGETWLSVENAADVVAKLGLEFVHFEKGPATLEWLNAQRDAPSVQAKRNGIVEDKIREGIVIRPLIEMYTSSGERIIVKHKRDEFMETRTPREIKPEELKILSDAEKIADDWVVANRMVHVLDKLKADGAVAPDESFDMKHTPIVIKAMQADVLVESKGEVVWSKDVEKAIGKATAKLYKQHISKI